MITFLLQIFYNHKFKYFIFRVTLLLLLSRFTSLHPREPESPSLLWTNVGT